MSGIPPPPLPFPLPLPLPSPHQEVQCKAGEEEHKKHEEGDCANNVGGKEAAKGLNNARVLLNQTEEVSRKDAHTLQMTVGD